MPAAARDAQRRQALAGGRGGGRAGGGQVLQGCRNAWAEVSKLPMALDDHSVHEGEELNHLGHHVAASPLD